VTLPRHFGGNRGFSPVAAILIPFRISYRDNKMVITAYSFHPGAMTI